ncbi:MAG: LysM peptidoglycan-binding domain-containing protein, partial [Lachnospiraceae bacterium]
MALCKTIVHVVQPNDTFYRLAQRYQTTVPDIIARNPGVNPYNLQVGSRLNICVGQPNEAPSQDELELNNEMRQAWTQHAFWTTIFMNSLFNALANMDAVQTRLLQTPEDIAEVFDNFYSQATVNQLTQLLTEHTQLAGQIMAAMKDKDEQKVEQLERQWYQNAEKIARLLANTNPKYSYDELLQMLSTHLDLLKRQMRAELDKEYEEAIRVFDENENHLMELADELT